MHNDDWGHQMTITLPLEPREEARLIAMARAKGLSADALVREAVDRILADAPVVNPAQVEKPQRDRQPIWEVIVENMKDVPPEDLAVLPRDGASQIDHYLYSYDGSRENAGRFAVPTNEVHLGEKHECARD